jgi:hypothetical protein
MTFGKHLRAGNVSCKQFARPTIVRGSGRELYWRSFDKADELMFYRGLGLVFHVEPKSLKWFGIGWMGFRDIKVARLHSLISKLLPESLIIGQTAAVKVQAAGLPSLALSEPP